MFPVLGDVERSLLEMNNHTPYEGQPRQKNLFFSKFHRSISVAIIRGFLQNFQKFVY